MTNPDFTGLITWAPLSRLEKLPTDTLSTWLAAPWTHLNTRYFLGYAGCAIIISQEYYQPMFVLNEREILDEPVNFHHQNYHQGWH